MFMACSAWNERSPMQYNDIITQFKRLRTFLEKVSKAINSLTLMVRLFNIHPERRSLREKWGEGVGYKGGSGGRVDFHRT